MAHLPGLQHHALLLKSFQADIKLALAKLQA